ncbi:hypothetical protein BDW62DRAFT_173007 [Aspergillus aurantiobrunneus]
MSALLQMSWLSRPLSLPPSSPRAPEYPDRGVLAMRWLTLGRAQRPVSSGKVGSSEHTEDINNPAQSTRQQSQARSFLGLEYPLQHPSTPDSELPYIDPTVLSQVAQHWTETTSTSSTEETGTCEPLAWIVVDNIVYDCTDFQHEHPGGTVVIRSFVGQDCSWQFWRFHTRKHMEEFGTPLRIGRTSGIRNRFEERPRYVGLSGLDDW